MIVIVNYGMGNLGAVANMLKKIGAPAQITSDPAAILQADGIILPGVGAFDVGMKNLEDSGLLATLNEAALTLNKPVLGLCLGMQLLTNSSEEGQRPGLGWIAGRAIRFRFDETAEASLRVPHMGWNEVTLAKGHPLFSFPEGRVPRFYFAHSYHVAAADSSDILAEATYGLRFVAAVQRANIMGVQFHPEKSQSTGLQVLRNFAALMRDGVRGAK
ncbi:MAG: imidazole glycerol phosphate synthase subunit HisH, partial [Chloroflexi bacterium]|nr:imidazole glycerol phosphate synthase subunit HisH [Chloroflexota bacterium]